MKKFAFFLAVALAFASGVAYAELVEGKVVSVDLAGNKLSITKADGTSADVTVSDATSYAGDVTALAEMLEGDEVKIEAEQDAASGSWTAKSVEVPVPAEAEAAPEAAPAQ
jgi:hypothetical protein